MLAEEWMLYGCFQKKVEAGSAVGRLSTSNYSKFNAEVDCG